MLRVARLGVLESSAASCQAKSELRDNPLGPSGDEPSLSALLRPLLTLHPQSSQVFQDPASRLDSGTGLGRPDGVPPPVGTFACHQDLVAIPMVRLSLLRLPTKLRRRARRNRMATLATLAALAALLFLVPFYVVYKPPAPLIHAFARRWPDVLWEVETDRKVVALTIDDFPSEHTAEILRVLDESGARATFFVIGGQVTGREDRLREAVRQGHELGNHAMHDEPARSLADDELEDQLGRVRGMISETYEAEGVAPPNNYFRPGSGFFSDRMRRLADRLGYRVVLGGIYPHDPQISWWRVNARHILSMLRPGAIIICHDRRSWTVPMLRKVLPEIKRRGYEVVTITELLKVAEEADEAE